MKMRLLLKAFGVFLMLVVFSYVPPALGSDTFEVSLTLPASVTPPSSFPVTIQVKKKPLPGYWPPVYPETTFRRIAVAYAPNDNLSFVGPYEIWQGTPTWSGTPPTVSITVNMQLFTARPTSSIIPLVVTIWDNGYNQNDFRGSAAAGVKIIK